VPAELLEFNSRDGQRSGQTQTAGRFQTECETGQYFHFARVTSTAATLAC